MPRKNAHRTAKRKATTTEPPTKRKKPTSPRKKNKKIDEEELELQRRAKSVVTTLQAVDKQTKKQSTNLRPSPEPIYVGTPEKHHHASSALFNAVECGDMERATRILKSHRKLVDGEGKDATPEQVKRMMECEEEDKPIADEGLLQGLRWGVAFGCPRSKRNFNLSAMVVALLDGNIPLVCLLSRYFKWNTVLGDHNSMNILAESTDLPLASFELLTTKEEFVESLPLLVLRAMRFGRIDFVRRSLRHYLGLSLDLDKENGQKLPKKIDKNRDSLGVTLLHLLALESTSAKQFDSLELDEKTTNAPSLNKFITPTHLAALSGNASIYKLIESKGGDWTINTDDGLYALNYAAASPPSTSAPEPDEPMEKWAEDFQKAVKPSETLRLMTTDLSEELEHEFQYFLKQSKRSVLEMAVQAGQHHNVAWLVHWFDEKEAMQWYSHNGESGILTRVVEYGDINMLSLFFDQPKFSKSFLSSGVDLLSLIVNGLRVDMLKFILTHWEKEEEKDRATLTCTPVHLQRAIELESLAMVRSLLEDGKVDVNSTDVSRSALHVACEMDFMECAELLIKKGAKPRAESQDGVSVMQHACRNASIAAIEMLVSKGISLDLKAENEKLRKELEKEKEEEDAKKKEDEMEIEDESPFEGWFMVLSGIFSTSKEIITQVIESNGGKVQPAVNTKTTHCVYSGRDGITDYGQPMGKGDKKYKTSKRKKLPFLDEQDILRYLKRAGQSITTHESASHGPKGHDEASFLHDVIKNCADKNSVSCVSTLLEHGADPEAVDDLGRTPLHYAVLYLAESDANIELLSSLDPTKKLMSQYDHGGYTPLLQACILAKWRFVDEFFGKEPDVNIYVKEPTKKDAVKKKEDEEKEEDEKDSEGTKKDPMKEEEGLENEEELKESEDFQDETIPQPVQPPKVQNQHVGWTLPHFLLLHGRTELFNKFIQLGGDVNTTMRTPDATPLIVASVAQPDICKLLLQNKDCKVNATNNDGQTLLHAIFKNLTIGRVLTTEEQQQWNTRQEQHPFTRQINRPYGDVSILHLTNVYRWNPNLDASIEDKDGATVFHTACEMEETTSCIRSFLNKTPSALHHPDKLGNTPLAIALKGQKTHVVLFLIDQGADINGHVYWSKKTNDTNTTQQLFGSYHHHHHHWQPEDKDGELVDTNRLRMSIYKYVMRANMSADVIYNMLQLPTCDMSAALGASISTGNLDWTERLIRSVDVKTPEDAGRFMRLLFTSTSSPSREKQDKMLELSKRLVSGAGGKVCLDVDDSDDGKKRNIFHSIVSMYKMHSLTINALLKLCGAEQSIKGLLSRDDEFGQTPLHMLVKANRFNSTRMVLSYMKEYGGQDKLREFLDATDETADAKTALHYAVAANSEGTYLNGTLLSLLVRFGSKITLPDAKGVTVAMVIGQMPRCHLDRFKLALAGLDDDGNDGGGDGGDVASDVKLPDEAVKQIAAAQKEREEAVAASTAKNKEARKDYAKRWKSLQSQWDHFRKKRLEAKSNIFQEERRNARLGRLIVPVDSMCPDANAYEVMINDEGDIYDTLLVTSDIKYNVFGSNSFHAMQLVQLSERYKKERVSRAAALATARRNEAMFAYQMGLAKYRVVERWGRIGDYGNTKSRFRGFMQLKSADAYFEKVFFDKTKNKFSEREDFEAARGAYNWVQKVYDEAAVNDDDDDEDTKMVDSSSSSSLHKSIETALRVITSLTKVRQELRRDGFGVDELPLGQLSPNMISQAYKILRDIESLVKQTDELDLLRGRALRQNKSECYKAGKQLTDLSDKFYATIPHDFGNIDSGFVKPSVIDDRQILEQCLNLVNSLEDVENSINLLLSVSPNSSPRKRLLDIRDLVGCDLKVVPPDSDRFELIKQYAGRSVKIAHLLEVTRYEDAVRFAEHEKTRGKNDRMGLPQNRLLWHGSKVSNILGILMKGLKVAPPDAPVTGYMFGKGIYFADVFEKSAGYASSRHGYGYGGYSGYGGGALHGKKKSATADIDHFRVMLLCEVAVGEVCKLRNANPELTEAPEGYDSVQGEGNQAPISDGMFLTKDGVGVPLGDVARVKGDFSLGHNEFIVYDESRVRIKYLMLFE